MELKDTGIHIRQGPAIFGAVRLGDSLAVVTASLDDGRKWIVSPNLTRMDADIVRRYAASISGSARRLAAEAQRERFLPEALAYVRSLPTGRKSPYLEASREELRTDAEADVGNALVAALEKDDSFRAAVEFESRVPYLVADRTLVDVMDAIHASFSSGYDEAFWIAFAADAAEGLLTSEQPFAMAQAAAWKSSRPASVPGA